MKEVPQEPRRNESSHLCPNFGGDSLHTDRLPLAIDVPFRSGTSVTVSIAMWNVCAYLHEPCCLRHAMKHPTFAYSRLEESRTLRVPK